MNNDFLDNSGASSSDDDFFTKGPSSDYFEKEYENEYYENGDAGFDNPDNLFEDDFGLPDSPGDVPDDSAAEGLSDDFSDDFDDDFSDDFDDALSDATPEASGGELDDAFTDDFADDFADVPSDGFSRFPDENEAPPRDRQNTEDDFDDEESGNDKADYADSGNRKSSASSDKFMTAKLVVVVVAIVFAVGLLFFVKLRHSSADEDYTVPDPADTVFSSAQQDQPPEENLSSDPFSRKETVSSEEPVSSEEETAYRELAYKEKSDDVKKMQLRLCELGYIGPSSCTGFFGDYTVKNLKRFQKAAGLEQTGKADVETLRRLFADDAPKAR